MDRKRYLIYSSANRLDSFSKWISDPEIDVAVVYYGSDPKIFREFENLNCKFLDQRQGFKIDNFLFLLKKHPQILEYDYILFADNDIDIDISSIKQLFQKTEETESYFAQPSHSKSSNIKSYYFLRHKPFVDYEFTNFIEIQFFVLKTTLIKETLTYWSNFSTGYGLDIFLSLWLKEQKNKIMLVHSITMFHEYRPEKYTVRGNEYEFKRKVKKINSFLHRFFHISGPVFKAVLPFKSYGVFLKNGFKTSGWLWKPFSIIQWFKFIWLDNNKNLYATFLTVYKKVV